MIRNNDNYKTNDKLRQCPSCGQILGELDWAKRRLRTGSYHCPKCGSKHHWDDLKRVDI